MPMRTKEEQRAYQNEWMARRRRVWFERNGPCVRCGAWEDLQVDHIEPAQKVDHKVWSWSRERREYELGKCQVLCVECHKAKTWVEREASHGSRRRYANGCRCNLCRQAKREDNARRRYVNGRYIGQVTKNGSVVE